MIKKINKKILVILVVLLAMAASCVAYAAGVVFFGGSAAQTVVTFTTVGTQTWTVPDGITSVEVLTVAGGGGGGMDMGGGGGGGGVVYNGLYSVTPGSNVTVIVGAGGNGAPAANTGGQPGGHQYTISATNGQNSVFGTITAIGGGYGGSSYYGYTPNYGLGNSGGSGGGSSGYTNGATTIGAAGTAGQGFKGGNAGGTSYASGGGGGAGGPGADGPNQANGGQGVLYSSISSYYFGGGGGGSAYTLANGGNGGIGGGGGGAIGTTYGGAGLNNGAPGGGGAPNDWGNRPGGNAGVNTGGGGGGGSHYNANNKGGDGGSGIVIIRYGKSKIAVSSIQKGLVGHWALDGDGYNASTGRVTDKTPYENHGTNNGATLTTDKNGQANGAMSFDGVNDYVSIGTGNTYFPLPLFSICTLAKSAGLASGMTANGIISITYGLTLYLNGSGQLISLMDNGTNLVTLTATGNLYDNQFHQLCLTFDGTNRYIFVDGVLKNSIATTWLGVTRWPTNTANIGHENNNPPVYKFNGSISDVRIYNRALSADEINSLYNSYKPSIISGSLQQGLVLDMPLTSNYTKTVTAGSQIMTDKTPYSHDGQNFGGVVSAEGTLLANTGNRVETTFAAPNKQGTISIWYKPTYSSTDSNRSSNLYSTGNTWVANSFAFDIRNCCGSPYDNIMYMWGSDLGSTLAYEWDDSVWQANEWINLTFVYDSKNYSKLYNNGVLVISNSRQNTTDFAFPNVFNIGAINAGGNSAKGTVSNLKVYNRALSETEIKLLYDKGR